MDERAVQARGALARRALDHPAGRAPRIADRGRPPLLEALAARVHVEDAVSGGEVRIETPRGQACAAQAADLVGGARAPLASATVGREPVHRAEMPRVVLGVGLRVAVRAVARPRPHLGGARAGTGGASAGGRSGASRGSSARTRCLRGLRLRGHLRHLRHLERGGDHAKAIAPERVEQRAHGEAVDDGVNAVRAPLDQEPRLLARDQEQRRHTRSTR